VPLLHERGAAVYLKSPIPVAWLAPRGWTDAALAVALGYALYQLVQAAASLAVEVVAQLVRPLPGGYFADSVANLADEYFVPPVYRLHFTIGDTRIVYGFLLLHAFALVLVALVGLALWRWRTKRLAECPHCLSQIPSGAVVCRECSLETAS
jgi:hypothetical protein